MEDVDAPEEVTLSQSKQEAYKLRKLERDNQRRVATQAKQRRKQQAMKKDQLRLEPEKQVRGTTEDTSLGKDSILLESQQDIHSLEEGRSKQLFDPASGKGKEDPNDLNTEGMLPDSIVNTEGMLPDSIVNFLSAREKQSQLDSTEAIVENPSTMLEPKKKKMKAKHGSNRTGRVQLKILNNVSSSDHVHNAEEFRQNRQLQVRRSGTMLQHANKAFKLLCKQGILPGHQTLGRKHS